MSNKLGKYVYRCPMATCRKIISTSIGLVEYPTCSGENKSHHKLMDFIEELSGGVPTHVNEKDKDRKEGRWLT